MSFEMVDARSCREVRCIPPSCPVALIPLVLKPRKEHVAMSKTLDAITEIIRNPKPPFRKADDRPEKAQKHRYERRKIKEIIKLGDWVEQSSA
jgi:hypothetical protein